VTRVQTGGVADAGLAAADAGGDLDGVLEGVDVGEGLVDEVIGEGGDGLEQLVFVTHGVEWWVMGGAALE
jgi:hypothetical protein